MNSKEGSSWIEFLLLLACILVIAVIVFIVLNPVQRRAAMRDEQRLSDITLLLQGFLTEYSEDSSFFQQLSIDSPVQIGTAENGCDNSCRFVKEPKCFNANTRVLKHINDIPVDPSVGTQERTGYYVVLTSGSELLVGSCKSETQEVITVAEQFFFSVDN